MEPTKGTPGQELTIATSEQFEHLRTDSEQLKRDPDASVWETWQGAVLLKDEIRRYCQDPIRLIIPFEDKRELLKPASYHLRLGSYYRIAGKDYELSDDSKILKIPRHGIAIVRTLEWINMPGFLVGRWNLKVKMVYRGLVWVGSLQVDSGYQGYLFCPLYNLSHREQELVYKEPLFTIDFVRTTRFDEAKGCELWKPSSPRPVDSAADLDPQGLTSAPMEEFKEMRKELNTSKSVVERFQARIDSFQAIIFAVLGIIVAALSFVSISEFADLGKAEPSGWQMATWIIVLLAILTLTGVLAFACIRALKRK